MRSPVRRSLSGLLAFATCTFTLASTLSAAPRIKQIKLSVTNRADTVREAEPIILSIADIKRIAPDFNPGLIVVTVTDATTIEEDAAVLHAEEVPSQIDDLDGDRKADEIA